MIDPSYELTTNIRILLPTPSLLQLILPSLPQRFPHRPLKQLHNSRPGQRTTLIILAIHLLLKNLPSCFLAHRSTFPRSLDPLQSFHTASKIDLIPYKGLYRCRICEIHLWEPLHRNILYLFLSVGERSRIHHRKDDKKDIG